MTNLKHSKKTSGTGNGEVETYRTTSPSVGRALEELSLRLKHVAVSLVAAKDFLGAREPHWDWKELGSISLTSRLLVPAAAGVERNNMFLAYAACVAADQMPDSTPWRSDMERDASPVSFGTRWTTWAPP